MDELIDTDALHLYVNRVLALHDERKTLNGDISAVYEEAKSAGFVTGIIRQIVREQQMEAEEREAHYALLDSYRRALGMLADTPLGAAAMSTATRVEEEGYPGSLTVERPRPFAEQPVHRRRGRPRKADVDDALARALDGAPAGAA